MVCGLGRGQGVLPFAIFLPFQLEGENNRYSPGEIKSPRDVQYFSFFLLATGPGVAINPPSGQGIQLSPSQPGQAITNFTSNAHSVFFTLVQSIQ